MIGIVLVRVEVFFFFFFFLKKKYIYIYIYIFGERENAYKRRDIWNHGVLGFKPSNRSLVVGTQQAAQVFAHRKCLEMLMDVIGLKSYKLHLGKEKKNYVFGLYFLYHILDRKSVV